MTELCYLTGDPDRWFPEPADQAGALTAKRVCWRCPQRPACAAEALDNPTLHGIWGGLSEYDRRQIRADELTETEAIRRDQRRAHDIDWRAARHADANQLTPCGTHTAYMRHTRNGEPVDDACLHAERAYQRKRKHRDRQAGRAA